jgi:hypothetical protein
LGHRHDAGNFHLNPKEKKKKKKGKRETKIFLPPPFLLCPDLDLQSSGLGTFLFLAL